MKHGDELRALGKRWFEKIDAEPIVKMLPMRCPRSWRPQTPIDSNRRRYSRQSFRAGTTSDLTAVCQQDEDEGVAYARLPNDAHFHSIQHSETFLSPSNTRHHCHPTVVLSDRVAWSKGALGEAGQSSMLPSKGLASSFVRSVICLHENGLVALM